MEKRALSPLVASILLVSLVVIIAAMIFSWNKRAIVQLTPPPDCKGVSFRAEIFLQGETYSLDVVNLGSVEIKGFVVKSINEGEIKLREEIEQSVSPGASESIGLDGVYVGEFFVVPKIAVESSDGEIVLGVCSEEYGVEVESFV